MGTIIFFSELRKEQMAFKAIRHKIYTNEILIRCGVSQSILYYNYCTPASFPLLG